MKISRDVLTLDLIIKMLNFISNDVEKTDINKDKIDLLIKEGLSLLCKHYSLEEAAKKIEENHL